MGVFTDVFQGGSAVRAVMLSGPTLVIQPETRLQTRDSCNRAVPSFLHSQYHSISQHLAVVKADQKEMIDMAKQPSLPLPHCGPYKFMQSSYDLPQFDTPFPLQFLRKHEYPRNSCGGNDCDVYPLSVYFV